MVVKVRYQRGLDAISPYVPGKPIEEVQREYGLADVIKLASNENPLGPSPRVVAAIQKAAAELNYYPDAEAYYLRQALATRLNVGADQVRIGNGADGVIREICESYLEDDDEVIVSRSSFPNYDAGTYLMRGRLIKTPLKDYGLDLAAMAAAVTPRTKLIFVCNPNNPTGTVLPAPAIDAFLAQVPAEVLVILDEAYYDFVDSEEYGDSLRYVREGRANVMVLRTFSKAYGIAGIRLGYGVAIAELLAPLRRSGDSFPVNRLAQVAGLAALEDDAFVAQTIAANRAGRHFLYGELGRLGLSYLPSHTNFILVHVGPHARAVFERLLRCGVIVRPCTGYDLPAFLRISIGTQAQNERLIAALAEALAEAQAADLPRSPSSGGSTAEGDLPRSPSSGGSTAEGAPGPAA